MKPVHGLERTGEQMVTTVTEVRRRFDMTFLRWQAQFDSPAFDRFVPWVIASCFSFVLILLSLARYQDLEVSSQIGHYLQALYLMNNGLSPFVSDLGLNVFAIQAAWILWPISWITKVFPTAETLLILQAIALGLGVVPLWRVAREVGNLRSGAAAALVFSYVFHPSIHNLNLAGFHPESLAIPALLAAYFSSYKSRWFILSFLVLVVLTTRADLGLAILALGLVLVIEEKHRPGWVLAGFGLTWFSVMAFVVQPLLGNGSYPHLVAFSHYGDGFFGVILGMLSDPLGLIKDLLDRSSFEKLLLLVGPVLFLPLVRPRYLIPLFPLVAIYLVAEVAEDGFGNPQQDVSAVVMVFIAAIWALTRIGTQGFSRVMVDRRVLVVLILTASVFFIRDSASSPYEETWNWGRRDSVDYARISARSWVDDEARLLVTSNIYPLVAEREEVNILRLNDFSNFDKNILLETDAVIFDESELDLLQPEIINLENSISELGFFRYYELQGIQVWSRRTTPR